MFCITPFGDRTIRNTKLANIASIFTLRYFNELTSLPRTWAGSYEHNENFMKKQGMSRASQVMQSSLANRIGSHHINKSLFLAARTGSSLLRGFIQDGHLF